MAFNKTSKNDRWNGNDPFHLALIILCCIGFLALYFKVDLDGSLNATYVATVSQQVAGVEARIMELEKRSISSKSAPTKEPTENITEPKLLEKEEIFSVTKSELSDHIPEACPPSGNTPTQKNVGKYSLIEFSCGDSNWYYQTTLVRDAATNKDQVVYTMGNWGLSWKAVGGEDYKLDAVGNPSFDTLEDFGGDNPITVIDLKLNEKPLKIINEKIVYSDGGIGSLQEAKFAPNATYTGGMLTLKNGAQFTVDFKAGTVRAK